MKAIRTGICVLVAFAVVASGAVEHWSGFLLEIGAAVLFLLWAFAAVRNREIEIHGTWLFLPLLALTGFALVQQLLGLSAYAYATKVELLRAGMYLSLCFLAVQSFRTARDLHHFSWFLVSFGFVVSLFGIVQYFTYNGKLYWFRVIPPNAGPFGPFVNSDHFAGFVELTAPFGAAMLLKRAARREEWPILSLFTILPVGALVLCASRGGIVAFLCELVVLAFLTRSHEAGRKQLAGIIGAALVAALLVAWLGIGPLVQRFENSTPADISRDRRVSMFRDTWQIFLHHPWTGTGLGTLEAVYPRYASYYDGRRVEHAHNDYLELLADTGLAGGLCGLAFVVILFRRALANLRLAVSPFRRSFYSGALAACTGLLVHSFVDFNLHIPSNALLFLVLGCLTTAPIIKSEDRGGETH
jgi:O-antigen ligase